VDNLNQVISDILNRFPDGDCYSQGSLQYDIDGLSEYYLHIYQLGDLKDPKCSVSVIKVNSFRLISGSSKAVQFATKNKSVEIINGFYVTDAEGKKSPDLSIQLACSDLTNLETLHLFTGDPYNRGVKLIAKDGVIQRQLKKGQLILLPQVFSSCTIFDEDTKGFEALITTKLMLRKSFGSLYQTGKAKKYKSGWIWHKLMEQDVLIQPIWEELGYFLPINNLCWELQNEYEKEVFPLQYAIHIAEMIDR
jgi:hypothetical protein